VGNRSVENLGSGALTYDLLSRLRVNRWGPLATSRSIDGSPSGVKILKGVVEYVKT